MTTPREDLEHDAVSVRDEFARTAEELARRARRLADVRGTVRETLEEHALAIALAAAAGLAVLGASIVIGTKSQGALARRRLRARRHGRALALRRAWEHPERVGSRASEAPVAWELSRKVLLAFSGAILANVASRMGRALVA